MQLTYGSFIAEERIAVGDIAAYTHDEQVGDGATTLLITSEAPLGTTTLILKQAGVTLVEGTAASGYTVDYQRGAITFATAVANGATITADYQRQVLTDKSWATITNDTVLSITGEFWKEAYSTGATRTVANQKFYTIDPKCIDMLDVQVSVTGASTDPYQTLNTLGYNWRYIRDTNQLVFGNPYSDGGHYFQFHYLSAFGTVDPLGTAMLAGTIDVQERYKPILQYGVRERYWQYRIQERINLMTAVSTERTTIPVNNMLIVADYWHNKYLETKRQLKPAKPPRGLGKWVQGAGIP